MDEARTRELDQRWALARALLTAARTTTSTATSTEVWAWALGSAYDLQRSDFVPCGWAPPGAPPSVAAAALDAEPHPAVAGQLPLFDSPEPDAISGSTPKENKR